MTLLSREANLVQNPALGAVLLWRFACGYTEHHPTRNSPPLPMAFVVLPLILHGDLFDELSSTRSSLRGFIDKFSASKDPRSDLVHSIHDRVSAWRSRSLDALRMAIHARLVTIVRTEGTVMPLSRTAPSKIPISVRPLLSSAEKLGTWLSELSLFEVSSILKIRF